MERFILLLGVASLVSGIQYDGLRVKFGWSDALADKEYFFKLPRTINEAEAKGLKRTQRPPGALNELRMYCPIGKNVCPLYDTDGFVAGLQIGFPVEDFETPTIGLNQKFVKWSAPASMGEPAREYWTATEYFVSEESLKAGAGPTAKNGATLQDGAVWVNGPDGRLTRIPCTEEEIKNTAFKKQNCIPNMGTHYYYNMTKNMDCEQLLPFAGLYTKGELVGTVFQAFGKLTRAPKLSWFEPPLESKSGIDISFPNAPACFGEWIGKYGLLSIHIYYINEPWTIKCSDGDSVRPGAPVDRLIFTGYRYARQISDEIKSLFSG